MKAMLGFLTPLAKDAADPLQNAKSAAAWLRQLPALDVIGKVFFIGEKPGSGMASGGGPSNSSSRLLSASIATRARCRRSGSRPG